MDSLNYSHLLYFWTVAREGSVTKACEKLLLAQPTISGQVRKLERSLGKKLFTRSGRNLVLTETGRVVFRYAEEIFSLGQELGDTLKGNPASRTSRLHVGIADVVPKLIAFQILKPALEMMPPVQIVCHEDKSERLLADLALHELDIVLADAPLGPSVRILAFNHLLGDCGTSIMGTPNYAKKLRKGFPKSLEGAPFLLPTLNTAMRRSLDQWFHRERIRPLVRAEFGDSALLKTFGQAGVGLFAVPSAIEVEVQRQYGVQLVGRLETVREQYYVISVEKKLRHPAVLAISDTARQDLFQNED
jgi:LysR family transcriptional activator of nhaA